MQGNGGLRCHGFQKEQVIFDELTVLLVENLGDTDNFTLERPDGHTEDTFCDVTGRLVDGTVEILIGVSVVNDGPFSRCEDMTSHPTVIQDPDLTLNITLSHPGV